MALTIPKTGATPEEVAKARREVDELRTKHEAEVASSKAKLDEWRESDDGEIEVNAENIAKVEEIYAQADKVGEDLDAANRYLALVTRQVYGADPGDQRPIGHDGAEAPGGRISLARRLFASEQWQEAVKAGQPSRVKDVGLASEFETAQLLGPANPSLAATFDGTPAVPVDQRLMPPVGIPQRRPQILDLITIGSTESDTVEYTEVTTETINEGGAAYGTDLPEATIVIEAVTTPVVRRGTTLPVAEGALLDQGQLRTWLNTRLDRGVRLGSEDQVINGDGLGQNFEGVLNRAGIGSYTKVGTEPNADVIHKGITIVRIAYEDEPTAVAIHPTDDQALMLEKDGNDGYLHHTGAFSSVPMSLWGIPKVATTAVAVDAAIVAAWNEATMWIRQGIELREFEQHSDFARKGLVLLRAQYRAAFKVLTPAAFCTLDFTV